MQYINFDVRDVEQGTRVVLMKQFTEILRPKVRYLLHISYSTPGELHSRVFDQTSIQQALSEISLKFRCLLFSVSCCSGYEEAPYKIYAKNGLTEIVYGEVGLTCPGNKV